MFVTVSEMAVDLAKSVIAENKKMDWNSELRNKTTTISEMIGTDDGAKEFIEKVTYDVYQGRAGVPLLYTGIYSTLSDANLPQTLTEKEFGPVQVVFLEKFEGGEIKFGTMAPGTEKVVHIKTYAAGIEYDEDIVEYNQYWRISDISSAFGEAYNKLLNHLHLSPIISGSYTTTGGGLVAQKTAQELATSPVAQLVAWDTDLPTTLRNAVTVLPAGTVLLINSADRFKLEDAIAASMYADTTPSVVKRKLSSANIVEYDGDEVEVGGKVYTYTGVTAGFIYLISPARKNFREYVKHDLRVDSGDGDLSRLIVDQVVGRARRGVLASLGGRNGAVKVDIAA